MNPKKVMLSGSTPTNAPTLGNYLGAIQNWVKLQKEYECIFMAVDLHAITVKQDPSTLRNLTYRMIASYIASGIDPDQAILVVQSHVPQHAELAWTLSCFSYLGELNRMTQFKDKSAKEGKSIATGLFTYPILMASDILLYQTNLVPVGEDQKQHLELTRDIAIRMNSNFGGNLFVVPEAYIPPVGARIMSLQDPQSKMSKSAGDLGTVYLNDSDSEIQKKFKRAVTDSGTEITDEDSKPGIQNLLQIQSAITGTAVAGIVASYAGKMYGHLKVDTAEMVTATLSPIRKKADELLADLGYLNEILRKGAEKARLKAEITLSRTYEQVGFIPKR